MKEDKTMTFDDYTSRQAHQQEISATRVGFLGGSDAALVYHVTECGVDGLSNTDIKRLKVLFGCMPPVEWGGNAYTKAGHDFEDFVADFMPKYMWVKAEREKVMHGKQYKNFASQAHADFYADGVVYECKCVAKKTTERVAKDYYAQLQWYYMLGAKMVYLIHGCSATEIVDIVPIEKNDGYIAMLCKGCEMIDEAVDVVCAATVTASVSADSMPTTMQDALASYVEMTRQIQALEGLRDKIKAQIGTYMHDNGLSRIEGGECSVSISKAATVRRLKIADVLRDFPQVSDDRYYSVEERKPCLSFSKIKSTE